MAFTKMIFKTEQGNFPPNFKVYFDKAGDGDLNTAFKEQEVVTNNLFNSINESISQTVYAPGKWTLKEVLQHLIDAERVFNYRALAFARNDIQTLPPFNEDNYAKNSEANGRTWDDLVAEFKVIRKSTEFLYNSFSDEALKRVGNASSHSVGVNMLGFVTIGHVAHHLNIIKERYLKQ
ncbi:MAG: DinB family protein [Ginsengibacter sp.]